MKLIILRTDIKTEERVHTIKPLFQDNPIIHNWSVDLHDIDNVLRVEAEDNLNPEDLIFLIKKYGFYCEELE